MFCLTWDSGLDLRGREEGSYCLQMKRAEIAQRQEKHLSISSVVQLQKHLTEYIFFWRKFQLSGDSAFSDSIYINWFGLFQITSQVPKKREWQYQRAEAFATTGGKHCCTGFELIVKWNGDRTPSYCWRRPVHTPSTYTPPPIRGENKFYSLCFQLHLLSYLFQFMKQTHEEMQHKSYGWMNLLLCISSQQHHISLCLVHALHTYFAWDMALCVIPHTKYFLHCAPDFL